VIVGHPGNRRVTLFQEALARRGLPPALVVAWRDLLAGQDLRWAADAPTLVRVESPGQDFEVEKLLLALGASAEEAEDVGASFLPAEEALRLPLDRGRLLCPRQWYRGFRAALRRLAEGADHPNVRWVNHPGDIVTLFDKRLCHRLFAEADVPAPAGLGPVRSFEELLARMDETGHRQVFVKLACGSSASGVVAFRAAGRRFQAVTTVELDRSQGELRAYNSRRIRTYESLTDVAALIDLLCREGAQVEEWVLKAGLDGMCFDLRVLVVGGEVRQVVPRCSQSPFTNLHLGSARGDLGRARAAVPPERWDDAMHTCRRVAGLFPDCLHVGVDLAFTPSFRRHVVLEANAFGDLLPGALWDGLDTYDVQLLAHEALRARAFDTMGGPLHLGHGGPALSSGSSRAGFR
jgi:glutathione synthase/RimK-type ligase-like ATP-grasp enzyme